MEGYNFCLHHCNFTVNNLTNDAHREETTHKIFFLKETKGEVLVRIAALKKEMGQLDQSMLLCNNIVSEGYSESIKSNALCLKVSKKNSLLINSNIIIFILMI